MDTIPKKESVILLLGDLVMFSVALWIALLLRHFELPNMELIERHVVPFGILFTVWIMIFFVAGLYEKHTLLFKHKLPSLIFNTQITNSLIAVLFFYIIPYFAITPKVILFIDLAFSFSLVTLWRLHIAPLLGVKKKQKAIVIGNKSEEMRELIDEVNSNPRYGLSFISTISLHDIKEEDLKHELIRKVYEEGAGTVVIDLQNERLSPHLPHLYNLLFAKVHFVDMHKLYEEDI